MSKTQIAKKDSGTFDLGAKEKGQTREELEAIFEQYRVQNPKKAALKEAEWAKKLAALSPAKKEKKEDEAEDKDEGADDEGADKVKGKNKAAKK